MANWEDLPGEIHAAIWGYFRNNIITSLVHVDNKPFETYVAECTAELSEEEREREEVRMHHPLGMRDGREENCYQAYLKAKAAEKANDRLAIEHALLISKEFAWSLRGLLKDRLETMIKLGKTIDDKYLDLFYAHRWGHNSERDAYAHWQGDISRRIQRMEMVVKRVNTWQAFDACWHQLPLSIAARIVGQAIQDCTVPEDTWDQIEDGKYGLDKHICIGDEVRKDMRRRIFRLSMVSKSLAAPVAHALAGVARHLDGQKEHQQHEVDAAERELDNSDHDSTGSKSAVLTRAEIWLGDLTILRNHAHKLYFVVSCWAVDSRSRKIPRKLKLQITRECLKLPKLRTLKLIINARRFELRWKGQRYEHTWDDDSTRAEFKPCHEGFEKLALLARCCPSAWLVKALRKYSAQLLKLSSQIDGLLWWGCYDWKVADLDWEGRIEALRTKVEALLSNVCTWAAESW